MNTMKNRIIAIVFSKDRALQLQATLDSFFLHCKDSDRVKVNVIYTASNSNGLGQYDTLKHRFADVNFIEEIDFRMQVLRTAAEADYVLFMVDDNIYVRDFKLGTVLKYMNSHPQGIGFSLRLGRNIKYNYMRDMSIKTPKFFSLGDGVMIFNWTSAENDFNYPLEVSSSVYRTVDIYPLLEKLNFNNPNMLEGLMAANAGIYMHHKPLLLCFDTSVTFCNPVNVVQTVCNNRAGSNNRYTASNLSRFFSRKMVVDVAGYSGFVPDACHQEVELKLQKKDHGTFRDNPLVTIEIVVYNAEKLISRTIESVLAQTYGNIEILAVDDGSTDRTGQIIQSYDDPRLRYIFKEHKNRWAGTNVAIEQARGEYILAIDADDYIDPDYVERMVSAAVENPHVDYIYPASFFLVDEHEKPTGAVWQYKDFSDNSKLPGYLFEQAHSPVPYPGSLRKRAIYDTDRYREIRNIADFVFLCNHATEIKFMRFTGHSTYYYRATLQSLSRNYDTRDKVMSETLNWMVENYQPRMILPQLSDNNGSLARTRQYYGYIIRTFEKHASGYHLIQNGNYYQHYADIYRKRLSDLNAHSSASELPLVTVEMTAYNAQNYIAGAVESVLRQTYSNIELIIVDDGSDDRTADIVSGFTDSRVRYIRQEHKNAASARNRVLAECRGQYICIVDSDDKISPEYIEKMVRFASEHGNYDWFYINQLTLIDENDCRSGNTWKFSEPSDWKDIVRYCFEYGKSPVPNPGSLVKREVFERCGNYRDVNTVEDFVYFCINAKKIRFRMAPVDACYYYRKTTKGLSTRYRTRNEITAAVLNEMIGMYQPDILCPEIEQYEDVIRMKRYYYGFIMMTFYKHAQVNAGRHEAVFRRFGDYYRSLMLENILKKDTGPGDPWLASGQERYNGMFREGMKHLKNNDPGQALVYFDQARNLDGKSENLNYARAVAYRNIGRDDQAKKACSEELKYNPYNAGASAFLKQIKEKK